MEDCHFVINGTKMARQIEALLQPKLWAGLFQCRGDALHLELVPKVSLCLSGTALLTSVTKTLCS